MAFIPKDWRDASQDLTTPITAAALENLETRVTDYAHSLVPGRSIREGGASSAKTASQNFAIIQEAIDEGPGTVYVPADLDDPYEVSGSLELNDAISLIGEGPQASILTWPTSLGPGTWALTPDSVTGFAHFAKIAGITFQGPGQDAAYGSAVSDMNGVKISAGQSVENCRIVQFHRGLGVIEDHLWVRNCEVTSNTYNLVWLAGSIGGGDHHYSYCTFSGASIASLYVEGSPGISGSSVLGCHMGFAPYGILSAPGMVGTNFINSAVFIESPIEFFGTAAIWGSNSTDRIYATQWSGCGTSQTDGILFPATTYEFFVRSGLIANSVFDGAFLPGTVPGTAYFSATGGGNNLEWLEFRGGGLVELVDNNTRFLHQATPGAAVSFCSFSGPNSRRGRFCEVTDGTVVKGNLLRITGTNHATKYDTAGRAGLGVALQGGTVGEIIAVLTDGWTDLIVADGVVGHSGIPLKPAPTAGRVVAASSFADGPIVGASIGSGTVGNALEAHIRCGTWG